MNVAARVRELMNEQRREIKSQVEGLVEEIGYQLEDEGVNPSEIHADVVAALRDMLGDSTLIVPPTPEENRQLRAVKVSLNATLTVTADSPEDFADQLDDIRSQAQNFGVDDLSLSGDYATAPVAELDEDNEDEDSYRN